MTGFLITLANDETYLCRNWSMHSDTSELILSGEFVYYTAPEHRAGGWVASLNAVDGFHVALATEPQMVLLVKSEDARRIQNLSAHLVGLTENLIDKHLPQEFKMILERTPEVLETLGGLMNDGIKKALDKLGKGK